MSLPRIQLPGGLSCSGIGLGTFGFGGRYERDESNDQNSITIIHAALDLGIDLFDTGEVYAKGHSEEVLGEALRGKRQKAIIATKFDPANSSKDKLIAACEASLKRLGTDVIDIYQNHWPNPAVHLEETMAGFEHLVKSGKVRSIGFSNTTAAMMRKAIALLPDNIPVATSQQEYNLGERFVEQSVLPFCRSRHMALLAYSPLGKGKLLDNLADEYGTSSAAIALQWLMQQPGTIPIPMTSKLENLKSNVAAVSKSPPKDLLDKLTKTFVKDVRNLPVASIHVIGSHKGATYTNLSDARANTLNLSPSPMELTAELVDGEMLKPVKVRPKSGTNEYDLFEGQVRYWAWRLAHNDKLPIPAQIC